MAILRFKSVVVYVNSVWILYREFWMSIVLCNPLLMCPSNALYDPLQLVSKALQNWELSCEVCNSRLSAKRTVIDMLMLKDGFAVHAWNKKTRPKWQDILQVGATHVQTIIVTILSIEIKWTMLLMYPHAVVVGMYIEVVHHWAAKPFKNHYIAINGTYNFHKLLTLACCSLLYTAIDLLQSINHCENHSEK